MPLEDIVRKTSVGRKVAAYALPFLSTYNPSAEAAELLRSDEEVREIADRNSLSHGDVTRYLADAYREQKSYLTLAKFADTADRLTSAVGAVLEYAGTFAGVAPGVLLNLVEEGGELAIKSPFLYKLFRDPVNHDKFWPLMAIEGGTAALPVLGDAYDFFTNKYIKTARQAITAHGKDKLLGDYTFRVKFDLEPVGEKI